MTAPGLILESLAHHSHAQPLAIEGQKKGSGTIFSSRRRLDVGNRRGDFDWHNVAGPVWIPKFRYGLRMDAIPPNPYRFDQLRESSAA
jgi:hypothetical protein